MDPSKRFPKAGKSLFAYRKTVSLVSLLTLLFLGLSQDLDRLLAIVENLVSRGSP